MLKGITCNVIPKGNDVTTLQIPKWLITSNNVINVTTLEIDRIFLPCTLFKTNRIT